MGDRFGLAAVVVTVIGFALQVTALVTRGLAVHRVPWGNMYEFTLMITAGAVAGWLVVLWRTGLRSIGVFVMTPITVLVFLAGTVLYTTAGPVAPALHSYWLVIHVAAVSLSSGVLMISGIASAVYLLRDRFERRLAAGRADPGSSMSRLPSLDKLDRVAYRTAIAAFPVYTFAIIAGAMWAEVSWGSYWSWDPKETCALVSWILFAGYLHARATAGWRGRWAAWICVVGLRVDPVQPVLREHGDVGSALLRQRRAELDPHPRAAVRESGSAALVLAAQPAVDLGQELRIVVGSDDARLTLGALRSLGALGGRVLVVAGGADSAPGQHDHQDRHCERDDQVHRHPPPPSPDYARSVSGRQLRPAVGVDRWTTRAPGSIVRLRDVGPGRLRRGAVGCRELPGCVRRVDRRGTDQAVVACVASTVRSASRARTSDSRNRR